MILTDFHIHSNFSDGKHSIPQIVDFYGQRGFKAISITDHLCEEASFLGRAAAYLGRTLTQTSMPLYLETLKIEQARAWEQYGMLVIPGVEVTKNFISNHRSAHILGIGILDWVRPDAPIPEILIQLQQQGALTVAAHPVSTQVPLEKQTLHLWSRRNELAPLFDAWEVGSGKNYFNEVEQSGLPVLANTDLHHFGQMDGWKTLLKLELQPSLGVRQNTELVFKCIREQRVTPYFYRESHNLVPFAAPRLLRECNENKLQSRG